MINCVGLAQIIVGNGKNCIGTQNTSTTELDITLTLHCITEANKIPMNLKAKSDEVTNLNKDSKKNKKTMDPCSGWDGNFSNKNLLGSKTIMMEVLLILGFSLQPS